MDGRMFDGVVTSLIVFGVVIGAVGAGVVGLLVWLGPLGWYALGVIAFVAVGFAIGKGRRR